MSFDKIGSKSNYEIKNYVTRIWVDNEPPPSPVQLNDRQLSSLRIPRKHEMGRRESRVQDPSTASTVRVERFLALPQ